MAGRGTPWWRMSASEKRAVGRGALVVALGVGRDGVERRDRGAGAGGDGGDEAAVVEVVVGGEHELDVLDAQSESVQAGLERRQRLVRARGRVEERERIAAQQPGVDRADVRQRDGDLDDVFHGVPNRLQVWQTTLRAPAGSAPPH
jgi:hypothetical protein